MKHFLCPAVFLLAFLAGAGQAFAVKYILRDGRILEGRMTQLSRVDEKSGTDDHIGRPIVLVDDGLRYVYFAKYHIRQIDESQTLKPETFKTGNSFNYDGDAYVVLGAYSSRTPFDQYGRRLLEIHHGGNVTFAEQAIVELTPYYLRVTGLRSNNKPITWDMRLATNAIPRSEITPILMNQIDPKKFEDRLKLVRFYYGGKLYDSADAELETIMQDWKDSPDRLQQIRATSLQLRQQKYEHILNELELRWENGQYQSVQKYILALEQDAQLPERLLESVRRFARRFDETDHDCRDIITAFKELYEQLSEVEKNEKIPQIIAEIEKELNHATLQRLTTFQLFASDPQLSAAAKLAIGITGWYAGAGAENSRLSVAVALPETERLIAEYLRSGNDFLQRQRILERLNDMETSRPDLIAGILATMKPPFSILPAGDPNRPGYYQFAVPNPLITPGAANVHGVDAIRYTVQLPPDYNPYQRYPMVVALRGAQSLDAEIDWWAGDWKNGERMGHATRHGYIVVAPDWNPPEVNRADYDFSVFSHAAVLATVKDAFRRFSVNTDKVFISGHGIGGTAAWDIALAHPDLWAGAIVFNAVASKYIDSYRETMRYIPLYLVWGEMEGVGMQRKWNLNATVLNRYLATQARPGDITVVRYIGRGMESFSEEILHALDWMKRRQRNTVPIKFEVETMRPWDSFFWWVEMPNLATNRPERMVDPIDFPPRNAPRPIKILSEVYRNTNNMSITITPSVANVQVFLTPDMVDFKAKTSIRVNGNNYHPPNGLIVPNIEVMLEDARRRSDRLHPFWAVLEGK